MNQSREKFADDIEKTSSYSHADPPPPDLATIPTPWYIFLTSKLATLGVETHGVSPVPHHQQTYSQFINLFFLWLSANTGILTFSTGCLGPIAYGLSLRDSSLVILFINAICTIIPAYFSIFGPITGLRQMIFARYSLGYIGGAIISAMNIVVFMGFLILNSILGGQTLASASSGNLSPSVGIVIIALISLLVTFCGYRILNVYEKYAWIPVTIVFVICTGVGGKHLTVVAPKVPATATTVLSFASTVAGFVISWACLASDYTIYMPPTVSKTKVFLYAYLGFFLPLVLLQVLGAAFMTTSFAVPEWADGYSANGVAGLLAASLKPLGRFGKFCMVVLSLSVPAACAPTMYSFGLSFQCVAPVFAVVPRYIFSIGATAILIPLAIVGSSHFQTALTNFLSLVGYYAAPFSAVLLVEHIVFRRSSGAAYDRSAWMSLRVLPTGWAGILSFAMSFALIIPSMDQVWFVGPIAKKGTGDIGFEVGFFSAALFYFILRSIDLKFISHGHLGGAPS